MSIQEKMKQVNTKYNNKFADKTTTEEVTTELSDNLDGVSTDVDALKLQVESLQQTLNSIDYVVESGVDSTTGFWYRKYKSGWLEQGGTISNTSRTTVIKFPKEFLDTTYTVSTTLTHCDTGWSATVNNGVVLNSKTVTQFTLQTWYSNTNTTGPNDWIAVGQGA